MYVCCSGLTMGVIAGFLKRIVSFFPGFSKIEESFPDWLNSPLVPIFHSLSVVLLVIFTIRLFQNARKQKQQTKTMKDKNNDQDETETSFNHLVWINKIISWVYETSSSKLPHSVETWIQDININIANQKNKFGTLIFGLREGSSLPWLMQIRNLKQVGSEIHVEILLKAGEFGFLVTVQEQSNERVISSSYSAIVAQFHCWYSATLSHQNGTLSIELVPIDKRPLFRFQMKPITKQTLVSIIPEAVAEVLRSALMSTSFQAHLPLCSFTPHTENSQLGDEESCYSNSESEIHFEDVKDPSASHRVSRSMSLGQALDRPSVAKRRLANEGDLIYGSEPSTRSVSPVVNGYPYSNALSESLGSLSNLTRSPSGRAPAKPIRLRERRLQIMVVSVEGLPADGDRVCCFELDYPAQTKTAKLVKNGPASDLMTFDLSSRSSKLKMLVRDIMDESTNQGATLGEATVPIDTVSSENQTDLSVLVKDDTGSDVGLLQLKFYVKENGGNKSQTESSKRDKIATSTSLPMEHRASKAKDRASSPKRPSPSRADKSETKVTMVTRVKGSPTRSVDQNPESSGTEVTGDPGVSFDDSSVAEAALRHLSARPNQQSVTKSKISITTVQQNKGDASSPKHQEAPLIAITSPISNGNRSGDVINEDVAISLPSVSAIQSGSSMSKEESQMMTPTRKLKRGDEGGVRRTRSLMFKSKKKDAYRRTSFVGEESEDSTSADHLTIPQNNLRAKKKSPSMTKLFSRMSRKKKEKVATVDHVLAGSPEESPLNGDREETPSEVSSTKIKRNRSFKNMLKGKKKSPSS